jgi:hypothetical protein
LQLPAPGLVRCAFSSRSVDLDVSLAGGTARERQVGVKLGVAELESPPSGVLGKDLLQILFAGLDRRTSRRTARRCSRGLLPAQTIVQPPSTVRTCPVSPHRGPIAHPLPGALVLEHLSRHLALEPRRCEGVHSHSASRPLGGELAGQVDEASLGGCVRRLGHLTGPHQAEDRGDVHDGAAARLEHAAPDTLGAEEGARQIHAQHPLEGLEGLLVGGHDLGDPGVVDQDVDTPEAAYGSLGEEIDVRLQAHVAADALHARPGRRKLLRQRFEPLDAPGRQHDVGTRPGQPRRELRSDPRRGPRHHGDAAVHAEQLPGIGHVPAPAEAARRAVRVRSTQRR